MFSKSLIQFSVDGQGCPLPVFWPTGDLFQKDLSQYSADPRTVVFSAPDPVAGHCWHAPLLEPPGHSQGSLAQSLVGSLLLSPRSWCTQDFVCALQESVSPVPWKFYNQIPLAFKITFPGFSVPLPDPQIGKSVMGPRTFTRVQEIL